MEHEHQLFKCIIVCRFVPSNSKSANHKPRRAWLPAVLTTILPWSLLILPCCDGFVLEWQYILARPLRSGDHWQFCGPRVRWAQSPLIVDWYEETHLWLMRLLTIFANVYDSMDVEAVTSTMGKVRWTNMENGTTHLTCLSAIVLIWFEKQYSYRPSFCAVMDALPVDCLMCFATAILLGSASCYLMVSICYELPKNTTTHPEVYVQMASSSDLICHCHLCISLYDWDQQTK